MTKISADAESRRCVPGLAGSAALPLVRGLVVLALFLTIPLLYVGGSVTTYRVGLAVPDWPTTFGMNMLLYDFWNAPFGVQVEHSHRLYAFAVGVFTVIVCVTLWVCERDRRIQWLGTAALVLVSVQGVLGGTRVTQVSTLLAAVHGFVGQTFFGLLAILGVVTGRAWRTSEAVVDRAGLRGLGLLIPLAAAIQVALGSWLRHFSGQAALGWHFLGALFLSTLIMVYWRRVRGGTEVLKSLRWAVWSAVVLVVIQLGLGIASACYLWPFDGTPRPVAFYQAVVRTSHQTTGALLFAVAVVLGVYSAGRLRREVCQSLVERTRAAESALESAASG
jgi:cytochrome c oxidase assembly protein subunit 15